jgi:hypothetical protein
MDMETKEKEIERVRRYSVTGGRGTLKSVSLAQVIRDTDGIGTIYDVTIEPNKKWHDHFQVPAISEWWIVAFEPTRGEFDGAPAALCGYDKKQFPLPMEAYKQYRKTVE